MKTVMVRYKVKPDRAAENEGFIKRVFEDLGHETLAGVHYTVFKLDDGVSFVHVASHDGDGKNPLTELATFKAFTAGIRERCEEPPVSVTLNEIASYAPIPRAGALAQ